MIEMFFFLFCTDNEGSDHSDDELSSHRRETDLNNRHKSGEKSIF